MAKQSIAEKVNHYWNGADKNDAYGLKLLDQCIQNVIQHRNTDPLCSFISRASKTGLRDTCLLFVKAAFGNRLAYNAKKAKAHPTGVAFDIIWDSRDVVALGNHYAAVRMAIDEGRGLRDSKLAKDLKKEMAAPKVSPEWDKKHETVSKSLHKLCAQYGVPLSVLMATVEADWKKLNLGQPVKPVTDGEVAF